jgi:hypothetical protein
MRVKSLEDRVIEIVLQWAEPVPFPPQDTSRLVDLWGTRVHTVPFPDPAVRTLIAGLQMEFRSGLDARILTDLRPSAFEAGGVVTVNDLIFRVDQSPEPEIVSASSVD